MLHWGEDIAIPVKSKNNLFSLSIFQATKRPFSLPFMFLAKEKRATPPFDSAEMVIESFHSRVTKHRIWWHEIRDEARTFRCGGCGCSSQCAADCGVLPAARYVHVKNSKLAAVFYLLALAACAYVLVSMFSGYQYLDKSVRSVQSVFLQQQHPAHLPLDLRPQT